MSVTRFAVITLALIVPGCESNGLSYREAGSHNVSNYLLSLNDRQAQQPSPGIADGNAHHR
jgi:hypothetical protein